METAEVKKVNTQKKAIASNLRVKPDTRKRVIAELSKINKKNFGRKVRVDQFVNLLLTLIKPEHIQKLQEESLSNSDRIEMKYREYIKKFGPVSKDEYLGLLLEPKSEKTVTGSEAILKDK